MSGIVKRDS